MLNNQLAQKYAQAIFELASEQQALAAVEQQLQDVAAALTANADLQMFLLHPRVLPEVKKDTLRQIFGAELNENLLKFLYLLFDRHREALLPAIVQEFNRLANDQRNICEAQVTAALPLTEAQQQALADKLGRVTGKTVTLKVAIDPSLIGGVIVQIGDKRIDGSVARQLRVLEDRLRQSRLTTSEVSSEV